VKKTTGSKHAGQSIGDRYDMSAALDLIEAESALIAITGIRAVPGIEGELGEAVLIDVAGVPR